MASSTAAPPMLPCRLRLGCCSPCHPRQCRRRARAPAEGCTVAAGAIDGGKRGLRWRAGRWRQARLTAAGVGSSGGLRGGDEEAAARSGATGSPCMRVSRILAVAAGVLP
ncbi:Os02g0132000 [Oryza sativa Japonica Group]|uniref:Os02g0132000 protein n=1 Tax=Oryza sativa subsp. japonica TaxID=39947 RepID=A0A0P0VEG5_ORYSJ|nr:Os02g0132000 [Oryza sativa Japonica Group]